MNPVTVGLGVVAIAYGTFTAWARQAKPESFAKLAAMKKFWGERAGHVIHVVCYTVVPILFGIVLIVTGLQGRSLF